MLIVGNHHLLAVLTNSDVNFIVLITMAKPILVSLQSYSFLVKLAVFEQ